MAEHFSPENELDQAWEYLNAGQISLARQGAERVLAHQKHPEAHHLLAEIALEEENPEQAAREIKEALFVDPAYFPAHFLKAWLALQQENYGKALKAAEQALEVASLPEDIVETRLLLSEIFEVQGKAKRACQQLIEAAAAPLQDPDLAARLGEALLAVCGEAERARRLLEPLALEHPTHADLRYTLGRAYQELGKTAEQIREFLAVYDLEADDLPPPFGLTPEEFQEEAEAAFSALPEDVRVHLKEVAILVESAPDRELVAEGMDPRLMGVFDGAPLAENRPTPSRIVLFQRNIEKICTSREDICEEISTTLLHEIGHYLGLDEDDLFARGLD